MRIIAPVFLVLGLALHVYCAATEDSKSKEDDFDPLECMFTDTGNCLRTRLARDLDQIEVEIIGKRSEPPISAVLEQAGDVIADVINDVQENGFAGILEEKDSRDGDIGEY